MQAENQPINFQKEILGQGKAPKAHNKTPNASRRLLGVSPTSRARHGNDARAQTKKIKTVPLTSQPYDGTRSNEKQT
jgi:hypothetical protein